jgi:murein DD-endopeptidase MepM/ murein hydrolase activator NlpD
LVLGVVLLLLAGLYALMPTWHKPNSASTQQQLTQARDGVTAEVVAAWAERGANAETGVDSSIALRQNIDALAKRLGAMQARMIQLDTLSERLAKLAGLPYKPAVDVPAQGGALVDPRSLSLKEFTSALDDLSQVSDDRLALLSVLEDSLLQKQWATSLTPGRRPVDMLPIGSRFGRRIDPITGQLASHTGLDFPGPIGTPVKATAGGVVVTADWHAGYGRMVEVDHGNQVITRYAHLSGFKVKQGDLVRPGQVLGLMGSSGRSTGPHLHFEVWVNGAVRNPETYLANRAHLAQGP